MGKTPNYLPLSIRKTCKNKRTKSHDMTTKPSAHYDRLPPLLLLAVRAALSSDIGHRLRPSSPEACLAFRASDPYLGSQCLASCCICIIIRHPQEPETSAQNRRDVGDEVGFSIRLLYIQSWSGQVRERRATSFVAEPWLNRELSTVYLKRCRLVSTSASTTLLES